MYHRWKWPALSRPFLGCRRNRSTRGQKHRQWGAPRQVLQTSQLDLQLVLLSLPLKQLARRRAALGQSRIMQGLREQTLDLRQLARRGRRSSTRDQIRHIALTPSILPPEQSRINGPPVCPTTSPKSRMILTSPALGTPARNWLMPLYQPIIMNPLPPHKGRLK